MSIDKKEEERNRTFKKDITEKREDDRRQLNSALTCFKRPARELVAWSLKYFIVFLLVLL